MSLAKNVSKNIYKNINKKLSGKYSHKRLDHAKQSATDALRNSRSNWWFAAPDLVGHDIAGRITKVSKTSPQNTSKTVKNDYDKEMPKERYICPKERQKIIDDLRLI